ncbi:MAG TPA: hypothetical protein VN921_01295 [Chthoniobacterales bacterium]|nr:hypothetical protein [Chthoniobacterales bacterium]
MLKRWSILFAMLFLGALVLAALPAPPDERANVSRQGQLGANGRPQQFLFQDLLTLPTGERIAIFLPTIHVAIGVQSKSGSRVLTTGELIHCLPFLEVTPMLKKAANGDFQPFNVQEQMLNCGPPASGEADRILAITGIVWPEK